MNDLQKIAQAMSAEQPARRLVWRAAVEVAERSPLGLPPDGERFLVPTVGGHFWGGPGVAALAGPGSGVGTRCNLRRLAGP